MSHLKDLYYNKFITSKRNNLSIDLTVNPELRDTSRDYLLYVDRLSEMYNEYAYNQDLYLGHPSSFLKFALNTLKKYKDKRDQEAYIIFKQIFIDLGYPNLTGTLKELFDKGIDILENAITYFCSYTTKGLPEINSSYEPALLKVFGMNTVNQFEEWMKTNYLAKLIVRYLGNHFDNYFYDKESIRNGEQIEAEVFKYCGRAVVLIILAQQETFRDKAGETNWCFEEYKHYTSTHPDQLKLLVYKIPNLIFPVNARPEIQEWYNYISTPLGIKSTTMELNWTHDIIRHKINADVEIIDEAYKKHFSNFVFNIN